MDNVFYDMAGMKNDVDMLSAYVVAQPSTVLSLSVPFRMGGGDLPVFAAGKSGGRLAINDDPFSMYIVARTPGIAYSSDNLFADMGTVTYMSSNNYFVDQKYVYENGALILSQEEYSLMRLSPNMDMRMTDNGTNLTLQINAIDIKGPKRSISSNSVEELYLRTNGSDLLYWEGILFTDVTITVESTYPSTWQSFFERMAYDAGIDEADYSVSSNSSTVVFLLEGNSGEDIIVNASKTFFDARLNLLV
jgi:hypothetical protein